MARAAFPGALVMEAFAAFFSSVPLSVAIWVYLPLFD